MAGLVSTDLSWILDTDSSCILLKSVLLHLQVHRNHTEASKADPRCILKFIPSSLREKLNGHGKLLSPCVNSFRSLILNIT